MKGLCIGSLGLSLGLLVSSAAAQDIQWRPVSSPTAAVSDSGLPGVTLHAPVAGSTPPALRQTSFTDAPAPTVRATIPDNDPLPLPVGPPVKKAQEPGALAVQPPAPTGSVETWGNPIVSQSVGRASDGCIDTPCAPMCCEDGGPCCAGRSHWLDFGWLRHICCDGCAPVDDCCDGPFGAGCLPRRNTFYASSEYLLWTVKSQSLPPLVTLNRTGNLPVLGAPGTTIAYGNDTVDNNLRSGGRFTLGFGLPCVPNTSLEISYFFLANRNTTATFDSNGSPAIGRPFTSTGLADTGFGGNQSAEIVAVSVPGLTVAGRVVVTTENELWGTEANLRHNLCSGCCWNVDFLWGFRQLYLQDDLSIAENLRSIAVTTPGVAAAAVPNSIQVYDHFHTRNEFFGGQVGLDGEYRWKRWFVDLNGKLAMGTMHQVVIINGQTVINTGTTSTVQSGGLLAQPTNIGHYGRDTFALVPELGLKIGYNFTDHLRGYVGYDVLYMSSVARPADQIDTNVNPNLLPPRASANVAGPALPHFEYRVTDFWAQGVTFGLEWRY